MIWQYGASVLSLLASGVISTGVAVVAWRRRAAAGAVPLTVLMLAAAFWSYLYAAESIVSDLSVKVLLAKVEYLAIILLPGAWLTFAYQYTGREAGWSRQTVGLLMIEPVIVLLLVWTNSLHGLVWHDIAVFDAGPLTLLSPSHGPAFWVHVLYSYVVLLVSVIRLIPYFREAPRPHRFHTGLVLVCGLVPWVGNLGRVLGIAGFSFFDLTPVLLVFSGIGLLVGVTRYRLFDIISIAQNAAVETLRDGLVVVDLLNRVVRINPAAEVLAGCSASEALARLLARLSPPLADLLEQHDGSREVGSEIVLGAGHHRRTYTIWLSPIREGSGELAGRLLLAQNISEHRLVEDLLLEERAALFSILQKAPCGLLLIDQIERCLYVNPAFTSITGYPIRDMTTLGAWFGEVFPDKKYRSIVADNWELDTQRRASRELHIRCRDGGTKLIEFRPTLLGDGRALLGASI